MPTQTLPDNQNQYLDTYSKILGIRQAQQTLQTGQALQQTAQAEAQIRGNEAWQSNQKQKEFQFLAAKVPQLMQDPNAFDENHVLRADYVAQNLAPGMPTSWAEVAPHFYDTQKAGISVNQEAQKLNDEQRSAVYTTLGGGAQAPDFSSKVHNASTYADFVDNIKKQLPPQAAGVLKTVLQSIHAPPADREYQPNEILGLQKDLEMLSRAALPAGDQVGPGGVVTPKAEAYQARGGLATRQTNVNAPGGLGQVGPTLEQGMAPQLVPSPIPNTPPAVLANGRLSGLGGGGASHAAGAPPSVHGGPPKVKGAFGYGPGEYDAQMNSQHQMQSDIESTRQADADYGTNRHLNDSILRLSADTNTGPGTKTWKEILGATLSPVGSNSMSDYQTIEAMLSRQAALATKQMGLPETNAGLQTAASLSGTTSYQPEALQTKVRLTDALVEGAHQYRQGLDKVVGTGTQPDFSKYQQFRSTWNANFDPNVYRAENDLKRGDKKDLEALKSEVGAAGLADLRQKAKTLKALGRGELPSG